MKKAEQIFWAIIAIFSLITGLWQLGIICIIVLIAGKPKPKKESPNAKAETQPKYSEFEIYKTAAEIEHQLHKDAMEDKP